MTEEYLVDGNGIDIMEEPWKVLVILDACRYDFFKEIYKDFFPEPNLELVISPSTSTMEWLLSVFGNEFFEDIVYISGSPYVNSKIETVSPAVGSFKATDHFPVIDDVWNWGWDKKRSTVNPWNINKGFLRAYKKYGNSMRYILHYMQPHAPYRKLKWNTNRTPSPGAVGNRNEQIIDVFKRIIGERTTKWFGEVTVWTIGRLFHIPCRYPMQYAFYKVGLNGLRSLYKDNLIFVLEAVSALADIIEGNILVTADHGERLGEHMRFGHWQPRHKEVVEVPWMWIEHSNIE
ncbi:MAG: hypothetical protein U9O98_09945 [Asgard group archaeon]|nr:hypothetical protein [Asgard group archaeon]